MNKPQVNISYQSMLEQFKSVTNRKTVNLFYKTIVRMNKKGNPYFNEVIKYVKGNVDLGKDYYETIETYEDREGVERETPIEKQKSKGTHHISLCVLENDNNPNVHYLSYFPYRDSEGNIWKPKVEYVYQNNPIERELFREWEIVSSGRTHTQVTETRVFNQRVDLKNIIEYTFDGVRYKVVDEETELVG